MLYYCSYVRILVLNIMQEKYCRGIWIFLVRESGVTIVLFTHGDSLLDTSIEQYIESEGQELQWLLERCGNRYHVLNNQNRSDDTQIKELLEKIEETVAQNNCPIISPIQETDNRMKSEEQMQPWREHIRSQIVSGNEKLDTSSPGYSAYGSFRSQSEADSRSIYGSSCSTDSFHTKIYESGIPKIYSSMDLIPPLMTGDEKLNTWSMGSSAYGSIGSRAESGSVYRSLRSEVSAHSSRFWSVQPISESVEHSEKGTQDVPKKYINV